MTKLFYTTSADKPVIAAALSGLGVKVRIKVLGRGLRVCFDGAQDTVLSTLNALGFVNGGGSAFDHNSFNQPHEIFVTYKVAK